MNSRDISYCLYTEIGSVFKGVFAADDLAKISNLSFPSCYIANTDISTERGKHWVCFYFQTRGTCDFFDSYGRTPFMNPFFDEFINDVQNVFYNSRQIQCPLSDVCGQHCIVFATYRSRNYSFNEILNIFKQDNLSGNDRIVNNFVKDNFDMNFRIYKRLRNQIAVPLMRKLP